jgi:hypothetical protein
MKNQQAVKHLTQVNVNAIAVTATAKNHAHVNAITVIVTECQKVIVVIK